jgi:hypothetical protein
MVASSPRSSGTCGVGDFYHGPQTKMRLVCAARVARSYETADDRPGRRGAAELHEDRAHLA